MSTLAFDITQFFPSLNYYLLPMILDKVDFDPKISSFSFNYLINRKTQYVCNNFVSPSFRVDIGMGQGSTLSVMTTTSQKTNKTTKVDL